MLVAQLSDRCHDRRLDAGHQPPGRARHERPLLLLLAPLLGGMRGVTVTALVQFLFVLIALVVVGVWMSIRRDRLVAAGDRLRDRRHGSTQLRGHGESVGRRARRLGRCGPDAVDRAWGRLLSGVADPLRDRTLVGVGASAPLPGHCCCVAIFAICAATMAAVARHALDDHGPRCRLGRCIARHGTLDCALGGQGRRSGDDLRPIGKRRSGRNRRLRPKRSRSRRSRDQSRHRDARRAGHGRAAAARLDAARRRLPGLALAAASLVLFTIGAAFGHDLYFRGVEPRAPMSRRLLVQRLSLLLATGLAATVAAAAAGRLSASGLVVVRARRLRPVPGAGAGHLVEAGEPLGRAGRACSPALPSPPISSRQTPSIPSSTSISNTAGVADIARSLGATASCWPPFRPAFSWRSSISLLTPQARRCSTPVRRGAHAPARFSGRRRAGMSVNEPASRRLASASISATAPIMSRLRKARRAAASSSRPHCSMFQSSSTCAAAPHGFGIDRAGLEGQRQQRRAGDRR